MISEQQARINAILVWDTNPKIGPENMATRPDLTQLQDIVIDLAHQSIRPDTLAIGKILGENMTPVIGAIMGSIGITTALDGINSSNFEDGRGEFDIAGVIGAGFDLDIDSDTSIDIHVEQPEESTQTLFSDIKVYNY